MPVISMDCPVEGVWSFMNPPGHHPDAKDFVATNLSGRPYNLFSLPLHAFWRLNVKHTFAWEKKVFAPLDGVVVSTANSYEDRETLNFIKDFVAGLVLARRHSSDDIGFFIGNHILMKADIGGYALFAHLRKGSISVHEGERIRTGQPISAIGNSGNTIQPHLHFHVMRDKDLATSMPLPFVFSEYEERQGGSWVKKQNSLPGNYTVFRFVRAA